MSTKRMLINATQKEELRVALVEGQTLFDLNIEHTDQIQKKASIYKGRVTRLEPSLEAAFVDYGSERHGFLPIKEISKEYFSQAALNEGGRPHIRDALRPGQEIIVQVDKEERGNKGAALTTFISLAGCYLVLMPNNPRAGGISRRIEGEERDELKDALSQLQVPEGMGLIIRTAGLGRSIEELRWDLEVLLSQWQAIQHATHERPAPFLIHRESDVIIRALRDYLRPDISEILVDSEEAYQHAKKHIQIVRPDYADRVKRYTDAIPLFNRFQIESQIESAFKREIALENGASIVIDPTEALIAIDINSARATEGSDIEETALRSNLAAAKEIARQLRLRDIGGLIVIDFIDMSSPRHQRMVENQLREELKADRARIQLGRISRFGLLEMSRQRLRPSLGDSSQVTCPRCDGQGTIRSIQSLALAIMRIIEDEAMKENTRQVNVQMPFDLAAYLLNEKREAITRLEQRHDIRILLLPNPYMVTPQYEIVRLKGEDASEQSAPSYTFITQPETKTEDSLTQRKAQKVDEPAIKHFTPPSPPAPSPEGRDQGFIKRILSAVFGKTEDKAEDESKALPKSTSSHHRDGKPSRRHNQQRHSRRSNRGGRNNKEPQQRQHQQGRRGCGNPRHRRHSGSRHEERYSDDRYAAPTKEVEPYENTVVPFIEKDESIPSVAQTTASSLPTSPVREEPIIPTPKVSEVTTTSDFAPAFSPVEKAEKAPENISKVKEEASAPILEKTSKAPNNISFMKLSPQEVQHTRVTWDEYSIPEAKVSPPLTQVVTKPSAVEEANRLAAQQALQEAQRQKEQPLTPPAWKKEHVPMPPQRLTQVVTKKDKAPESTASFTSFEDDTVEKEQ